MFRDGQSWMLFESFGRLCLTQTQELGAGSYLLEILEHPVANLPILPLERAQRGSHILQHWSVAHATLLLILL